MGVTLNQHEAQTRIRVEGSADISDAAEFKALLIDAVARGRAIRVELGADASLDVAAIQLLWAGAREARASSLEFTVFTPSPDALSTSLAELGFEAIPFPVQQEN
jgi:hypothetical protein